MSTNKTTNYGLHQWQPTDDFLREEFNENFAALDNILVMGQYTGNNSSWRTIYLGFRPRAVILVNKYGQMYNPDSNYGYGGVFIGDGEEHTLLITENGFKVSGTSYWQSNLSHLSPYYYIAIK